MSQQRRQSGFIVGVLSLGLLVGAALMASPAQAWVTGLGPYYPEAAWDQIKGVDRFVVLTNMEHTAVLDTETGLVWERSPQTALATWTIARRICANKIVGNRKGWRLPSIPELASLIDPSVGFPGPHLTAGHPFTNVLSTFYWSASSQAGFSPDAWVVGFAVGAVNAADKLNSGQVWCVRGGMNANRY